MFVETIDAIPFSRRPVKVHADKGYDSQALRDALQERGIQDRIARRRVDSSEKLGGHRWVVERTHSWLNGFRRLKIRYERKARCTRRCCSLGCALICFPRMAEVLKPTLNVTKAQATVGATKVLLTVSREQATRLLVFSATLSSDKLSLSEARIMEAHKREEHS